MATIRLVPSTYYLSSTSYLSVSDESNMYHNTDNTTYATVYNSRNQTSNYYIYLRGFNFDAIPSGAVINSFTIKVKGNYSGGYSQVMYLYDGTSTSYGASNTALSSTVTTHTFNPTHTWEEIVASGSDFGIRINCRRNSRNTAAYIYIYGAEILVDYTMPTPRTITTSLSGDGTISPSGANTYYDGDEIELTITPTNKADEVTATRDGVDISSQLVTHGAGNTISSTPNDVNLTDIQSGSSYAEYCIGYSAENPSSSGTSSNMYASDLGYADYSFDFSSIPSNATIEEVSVRCYGHRESSTIDSTHVSNVAVLVGSTQRGSDVDFPSTSNTMVTIDDVSLTRAELSNVVLRYTVGYYGGLILGITFEIVYSIGTGIDHYTYTFTVSADSTIAVTIGASGNKVLIKSSGSWVEGTPKVKVSGTWQEVSKVFKKVNGSWVEQEDKSAMFEPNAIYIGG